MKINFFLLKEELSSTSSASLLNSDGETLRRGHFQQPLLLQRERCDLNIAGPETQSSFRPQHSKGSKHPASGLSPPLRTQAKEDSDTSTALVSVLHHSKAVLPWQIMNSEVAAGQACAVLSICWPLHNSEPVGA